MFKQIDNFDEANKELFDVAEKIELKTGELENAREKYLLCDAEYENEYSRTLLETKLKRQDATQSEIVAQAKVLSYEKKLEMIKAEFAYKRLQNEVRALRDKLDVCKEISWNLRKERTQS